MKVNDNQSAILFTEKENGMIDMEVVGKDGLARDEALAYYDMILKVSQNSISEFILSCTDEGSEN